MMTAFTNRLRRRFLYRMMGLVGLCALPSLRAAHASVALLVEQPYGKLALINPAGHSAVYFDHICAETPLELRPCRAGELGVVISRYDGIGKYDWVAMPLLPYLYAVDSVDDIPAFATRRVEDNLRDRYRRRYLEEIVPDLAGGAAPPGNWYELVGSAYDRTIYGFQVDTTPEQDAHIIALLNDRKNVERYNGAFVNCADFARVMINRYYPHAVRRNFIADLGITTPKSVARGLAHYARKHPEVHLQAFMVPQVKGDLPRSHPPEDIAEGLLKKYGLPLVVLSPEATAVVFVAYVGQGRFAMPKNASPLLDIAAMQAGGPAEPSAMQATKAAPDTTSHSLSQPGVNSFAGPSELQP